jgi:hypothetical protein
MGGICTCAAPKLCLNGVCLLAVRAPAFRSGSGLRVPY